MKRKNSLKFRQIRVKKSDGSMIILRNQKELEQIDLKSNEVYYTTSLWREPIRMHGKGSSGYMGSDFVFDIDAHTTSLEQAAKDTILVLSLLGNRYSQLVFTGRGFQVVVKGYRGISLEEDKIHREQFLNYIKMKLAAGGFSLKLPFDIGVYLNPYGVVRLPETYNGKSGLLAREITSEMLTDLFWIDMLPRTKPWRQDIKKEQISFWSVGITSKVIGTRNHHALMFDFDKMSRRQVGQRIIALAKQYNFGGDFVVLETNKERYSVISPTCVESERLLKIVRASGCHPAFVERFMRYNNLFIRLQAKHRIPDNAQLTPEPIVVDILKLGSSRAISKGHWAFFKAKGLDLENPLQFIGKPIIKIRTYRKNAQKVQENLNIGKVLDDISCME